MPQHRGCIPWNKGIRTGIPSFRRLTVTDDDIYKIVSLYTVDGLTLNEIGKLFNCSCTPITRILHNNGIETNDYLKIRQQVLSRNRHRVTQFEFGDALLSVKDGYTYKYGGKTVLCGSSILELTCCFCGDIFERKFFLHKLSLKNLGLTICLNCYHYFGNKVMTSKAQRKIAKMLGASLNYPISKMIVDICLVADKIVIEYDGWFYHKDSQVADRRRDEYLKSLGYKILRVKSRRKIPDIQQLRNGIDYLKNGHTFTEIVLDDWGY